MPCSHPRNGPDCQVGWQDIPQEKQQEARGSRGRERMGGPRFPRKGTRHFPHGGQLGVHAVPMIQTLGETPCLNCRCLHDLLLVSLEREPGSGLFSFCQTLGIGSIHGVGTDRGRGWKRLPGGGGGGCPFQDIPCHLSLQRLGSFKGAKLDTSALGNT